MAAKWNTADAPGSTLSRTCSSRNDSWRSENCSTCRIVYYLFVSDIILIELYSFEISRIRINNDDSSLASVFLERGDEMGSKVPATSDDNVMSHYRLQTDVCSFKIFLNRATASDARTTPPDTFSLLLFRGTMMENCFVSWIKKEKQRETLASGSVNWKLLAQMQYRTQLRLLKDTGWSKVKCNFRSEAVNVDADECVCLPLWPKIQIRLHLERE